MHRRPTCPFSVQCAGGTKCRVRTSLPPGCVKVTASRAPCGARPQESTCRPLVAVTRLTHGKPLVAARPELVSVVDAGGQAKLLRQDTPFERLVTEVDDSRQSFRWDQRLQSITKKDHPTGQRDDRNQSLHFGDGEFTPLITNQQTVRIVHPESSVQVRPGQAVDDLLLGRWVTNFAGQKSNLGIAPHLFHIRRNAQRIDEPNRRENRSAAAQTPDRSDSARGRATTRKQRRRSAVTPACTAGRSTSPKDDNVMVTTNRAPGSAAVANVSQSPVSCRRRAWRGYPDAFAAPPLRAGTPTPK